MINLGVGHLVLRSLAMPKVGGKDSMIAVLGYKRTRMFCLFNQVESHCVRSLTTSRLLPTIPDGRC